MAHYKHNSQTIQINTFKPIQKTTTCAFCFVDKQHIKIKPVVFG